MHMITTMILSNLSNAFDLLAFNKFQSNLSSGTIIKNNKRFYDTFIQQLKEGFVIIVNGENQTIPCSWELICDLPEAELVIIGFKRINDKFMAVPLWLFDAIPFGTMLYDAEGNEVIKESRGLIYDPVLKVSNYTIKRELPGANQSDLFEEQVKE